ncbi:sugar phosphate isomerase/epimerase family protein [Paenibacillus sp.]|uniref:sugar phosphate isomerase/epimerase family protein n=1 Tax=Paenibacillus sp. TaxID=58172 RepID=UPI00281216F7|nr:sugar phosphate isomerase/epimerase family protein [Paenibacillus sp.]
MSTFRTALNASTLFPFRLTLPEQIRVAAEAGYEGIEFWMKDVDAYLEHGGTLAELRRYAGDAGIVFANAIAFWKWADLDERERAGGLELAVREAERLAELGCFSAAAPPFGQVEGSSLERIADCYGELAGRIRPLGVDPLLEFWGRAKALSRLEEAIVVADRSGVPEAKLLLDPFHMYTGGSSLETLSRLSGDRIGIVHVNDYPADPPRETIQDRDRVFPGEGVFSGERFASTLHGAGYRGFVSLELFIPDFGDRSALEVARRGLEALKRIYGVQ